MADELVLYTNPRSRGRMARWMLEEVGQPYRAEILEYARSMKAPEYLAINPMGKVPALRHGDTVVTEAAAICAYLADVFPEAVWRRRRARACVAPIIAGCSSPPGRSKRRTPTKRSNSSCRPERTMMVGYGTQEGVLAALEDQLNRSEYIAGDRFTAADVYVGSHIGSGMMFGMIDKRPAFERYWGLVSARPAAQRAREIDDKLIAEQRKAG